MRSITAAIQAEKDKEAIIPIELYQIFLEDETLYLATWAHEIAFYNEAGQPEIYMPAALSRRPINRSKTLEVDRFEVNLDNVGQEWSGTVANYELQGVKVNIWKTFLERNQKIIDIDNDNTSFSEGTLTDVVAVNDNLELANNPALEFDGVDDYVEINSIVDDITAFNNDKNMPFNIEIITKPNDNNSDYALFGFTGTSSEFLSFGVRDGAWMFRSAGRTPSSNSSAPILSDFEKINAIWDGTDLVIKQNDNEIYRLTPSGDESWFYGLNEFAIGKRNLSSTDYFYNGYIESIKVYNNGILISDYKMNEGSGNTLVDYAGNNDGTIIGAIWTTDTSRYLTEGIRQSPQLDLSPAGTVERSMISWQETLNSQIITIETSIDGGSTWDTVTNGGSIPNITGASTLDVRQTLETDDTTVTPKLEKITVEINGINYNVIGDFTDRVPLFSGEIDRPNLNKEQITVEIVSKLNVLDKQAPARRFGGRCPWVFGGVECGVTVPTNTGTIQNVDGTGRVITVQSLQNTNWTHGSFKFGKDKRVITDYNAVNNTITVEFPVATNITAGESYSIKAGCSKVKGDETEGCTFWNNTQFFGGFSAIPQIRNIRE